MIALDTSAKMKQALAKSPAQVSVAELKENDSEELEESEVEEAEMDNSDEENSSGADGDESDAENGSEDESVDKSKANPGWADAMRKILNTKKPKRKKSIVLSKAKKLNEVLAKPKEEVVPFEIEDKGVIKKETIKVEEKSEEVVEIKKQKRKDSLGIRVKPSVLDRERERRLQKIATNGVVQLFNAVRQQQKEIEDKLVEAGPMERKREKALKNIDRRAFLDVLMGGTNSLSVETKAEDEAKKEEEEDDEDDKSNKKNEKVWSVLRDDFVMGAKLKDWNKEDTDEDSSAPEEMEDSD